MNSSGLGKGDLLIGVIRSDASTAVKLSAVVDAFEAADDAGRLELLFAAAREAMTLTELLAASRPTFRGEPVADLFDPKIAR